MESRFNWSLEERTVEARGSATRIVIVFPALNEREAVGLVLDGTKAVMDGYDCRMLVVDGHSNDGTDEIAGRKGAEVIYQRGKGYGDALRTGFFYARRRLEADVIVMMDADFTYDPQEIPALVEPILGDEADLVVGNRFAGMHRGAMSFGNKLGNRLISLAAKFVLGLGVYDTQSGMRAFRSELLDRITLVTGGMPLAIEMLAEARATEARILEVPISYRPRVGETKLNPIRDGGRIVGIIVRLMLDTQPLLFFGSIGIALEILGVALHGISGTIVFPSLLMFGAIPFFSLGIAIGIIKRLRKRTKLRAQQL